MNKTINQYPACVEHLDLSERMKAAEWCFDYFGYEDVDIWRSIEETKVFYFKTEKQATWFAMRW